MLKFKHVLLTSLLVLTGCDYERLFKETPKVTREMREKLGAESDGNPLPPFPSNPDDTVAGVDSDNDGLRDDVEIWIAQIDEGENSYNVRQALRQYARYVRLFTLGNEVREDMMAIMDRISCTMDCHGLVTTDDPHEKMAKYRYKIAAMIDNTSARRRAAKRNYGAISGGGSQDISGYFVYHLVDELCEFKIQNKEKLMTLYKEKYKGQFENKDEPIHFEKWKKWRIRRGKYVHSSWYPPMLDE